MNAGKLTAWERWELGSLDAGSPHPPAGKHRGGAKPPSAAEIEQIHRQAQEDGYRQGHAEGYQAGFKEGQAKALAEAQRLMLTAGKLDAALIGLEAAVADELLALALELARVVVHQEISAHPEALLAVVRAALAQLPHQHVAIYLHPDDASLLRSYMGDQLAHAGHRIHEDFKLGRGDCMLEAGGTQLDATVAMRWRRALEALGVAAAWQEEATDES